MSVGLEVGLVVFAPHDVLHFLEVDRELVVADAGVVLDGLATR